MDIYDPIVVVVESLSCVQLLATPWTVACQAPCPLPSKPPGKPTEGKDLQKINSEQLRKW